MGLLSDVENVRLFGGFQRNLKKLDHDDLSCLK